MGTLSYCIYRFSWLRYFHVTDGKYRNYLSNRIIPFHLLRHLNPCNLMMILIKIEPGAIHIKIKRKALSSSSSVIATAIGLLKPGESLNLDGWTPNVAKDLRRILLALNKCTSAGGPCLPCLLPYMGRAVGCFLQCPYSERHDLYRCLDRYAFVKAMRAIKQHVRWMNNIDPRGTAERPILNALGMGIEHNNNNPNLPPSIKYIDELWAHEIEPNEGDEGEASELSGKAGQAPPSALSVLIMLQQSGSPTLLLGKFDGNDGFGFGAILWRRGSKTVAHMKGDTGRWLRAYQKEQSTWSTHHNMKEEEAKWLSIHLPGDCYGQEVTICPLSPSRWLGDEFNEHGDEEPELWEEIRAYSHLPHACSEIHQMGTIDVIVDRSGTVLYRSLRVPSELLADGCMILNS